MDDRSLSRRFGVVLALGLLGPSVHGCSPAPAPNPPSAASSTTTASAARETPARPAPKTAPPKPGTPIERPTKPINVAEARRYMLALINRDRATAGLRPVELDEGAPTTAGQLHAEDMVRLGYLGHWGSDGSVPEQRHSEAGGSDMVLENALCFTDEQKRQIDPKPLIDPKQIERAESLFFDEVPPNDGHRKNILKAHHTKVGIGIAQSTETATELPVPCFSQEFTDNYGTYAPIPTKAKVGSILHVEGTLEKNVRPTGVGLARIPTPRTISTAELNKRRSYPVPKPYQMYWGPGFVTPILAKIDGPKIAIDVPLSEGGQPGLYEVSVWGKLQGSEEQTMLSLRTILVD